MKKLLYSIIGMHALLLTSGLYAEEIETPTPPRDQGFSQTLIMIAIALVFFYIILWRPEQKRRKAMEELRSNLKKGDKVTAMGTIGTVVAIKEHTIIVKMFDGSKIEFLKAAISEVVPGSDEDAKKAEKDEANLAKQDTK